MASIPHVPLAAEPIITIGSFAITNAFINALIVAIGLMLFAFFLRTRIKEIPGRFQSAVELLFEFLLEFFDKVTKDRERSRKCFPLVATFFLFILLSNWFGLLPGTGSIGVWQEAHGERVLFPILRPANSDLNLTIAMSLLSVFSSHLFGVIAIGFWTHANKFIQLGTIWKALKTLNPIKIFVSLVEFLVGLIEIFGEIAKVASLSLRLFGNIFAGEVLITVIGSLAAFLAPLPFMAIELLVGLVQATVFSVLTLVYMNLMMAAPYGSHDEAHESKEMPPAKAIASSPTH